MPTDAELLEQINALKEQVVKQQAELDEKNEQLNVLRAKDAGWLIETPNPLYDGMTAGVQFVNGQAFIPDSRVIDRYKIPSPKDEILERMPEKELKQLRDAQAVPTSERAARFLRDDFGYTITHFSHDELDKFNERVNERAQERAEALALQEQIEQAQMYAAPQAVR